MATAQKILEQQKDMESMIASRLDEFESRMKEAISSTEKKFDLDALASDFAAFKDMVLCVLRLLQDQVASLAHQVDEMDCQSRRKALLFSGVQEQDGEDPATTVSGIVSRMGVAGFGQSSIQHCVRIVAKNPKRPQLKSSGMVVSEFLTKSRQDIYARARRHFGISACWTWNGAVFLKLADGTNVKVATAAQLDELCRKHPAATPTTSAAARTPTDKPATKPAAPATRSKTGVTSRDRRAQ